MKDKKGDYFEGQPIGDKYLLVSLLGKGQDGEVWKCKDETIYNKEFAMKILNNIEQDDKKTRFEREIKILASINHPHIVTIISNGRTFNPTTSKKVPYYVMEFLDGVPLNDAVQGVQPQDTYAVICRIFQQVANALIELHEKGITHGDIKSANILVNPKNIVAKLTDFGFGLFPGENEVKREEYPKSSHRSPDGLTPKESDIYKLGKTFSECVSLIDSKLSLERKQNLNTFFSKLITRKMFLFRKLYLLSIQIQ